jgi:hypothetical protein
MTLDDAVQKATLYYPMIGAKGKKIKNDKIKVVSRILTYKKEDDEWDVTFF